MLLLWEQRPKFDMINTAMIYYNLSNRMNQLK